VNKPVFSPRGFKWRRRHRRSRGWARGNGNVVRDSQWREVVACRQRRRAKRHGEKRK